ncbi:MAG: hypothetical protein QNK42_06895 [Pseudodonghicola sp.]|nr:hypothetical protein [Pseudodonghicola sp.]
MFLTIMLVANMAAGTLGGSLPKMALAQWGISYKSVLEGDLLRLLTGTFLSHDVAMFLRQFLFAAGVIGYYEWRTGTLRAVVMFFSIDITGSVIVLFGILPVLASYGQPHIFQEMDVGMSAGGFGLIGAILCLTRHRWAWLGLALIAISCKIWFSFEIIADSAHLLCLFLGFFAQMTLGQRRPRSPSHGKPAHSKP